MPPATVSGFFWIFNPLAFWQDDVHHLPFNNYSGDRGWSRRPDCDYNHRWRTQTAWNNIPGCLVKKFTTIFATTQLNSTQSWVSLIFLWKPHHTTNHNRIPPLSQLLNNQTRPNSVYNLISTKLEDSCEKKIRSAPPPYLKTLY